MPDSHVDSLYARPMGMAGAVFARLEQYFGAETYELLVSGKGTYRDAVAALVSLSPRQITEILQADTTAATNRKIIAVMLLDFLPDFAAETAKQGGEPIDVEAYLQPARATLGGAVTAHIVDIFGPYALTGVRYRLEPTGDPGQFRVARG